jgi:hypothetical protein
MMGFSLEWSPRIIIQKDRLMKCKAALLKPTLIDHLELFLGMFKFSPKKINEEDFVKIFFFK